MSQLQQIVLRSFMFVFHVRSSQVGWSVITDLCDQVVGVGGVVNKKK
jgi:hypothetical protein